jgi:hypothetical protein
MWTWSQSRGSMSNPPEFVTGFGYAGGDCGKNLQGKNNPEMQDVPNVGPLPRGLYTIAAPIDTVTHGPYVLWLTPDSANQMFTRSGFGIHGDSVVSPGDASDGCIVLPRSVREVIGNSNDNQLEVIS